MKGILRFRNEEGGFTTPAAAIAILLVCSLVFICARGAVIGARSGQIQYVADAGALAADNVVAEFVTAGQVVDAALLSLSLLAVTVYGVSAVAAFIPGGQGAAAKIAEAGGKIFKARDALADTAIKGLDAAQRALPALCAVRSAQVIRANAQASGLAYAGMAITSPMQGIEISLADDSEAENAAKEIESKEEDIQKKSVQQKKAQEKEDAAKERAWKADCGNEGMSMYERAGHLSSISETSNPYFSSSEHWSFSVPINRATAYYECRYNAEPGAGASGSPESIAESVARKRFYAYARTQVSQGYIETTDSGSKIPHLIELARNTSQIKETSLYTEAIYPVSVNGETSYLHAYGSCPTCAEGTSAGSAAVSAIDSGSVQKCPSCNFSATTLGRVPSASTSINNGFEYYYLEVVKASREYEEAIKEGEQAKKDLKEARESVGKLLEEALKSIAGKRYDPQPPGRYGCVCVVMAPSASLKELPFIDDSASIPARIAISGATLAPDPEDDAGNIITDITTGLVSQEDMSSGLLKTVFGAWGTMLGAYTKGTNGIKTGFRKVLGTIPIVGTEISDKAVSTFEKALTTAGLEPADLKAYKPVLVNTARILERDDSGPAGAITRMKQGASIYGAISVGDMDALVSDIKAIPEIEGLLDENGLEIASLSLADLGLGTGEKKIYFPVPKDLAARLEETKDLLQEVMGS